MIKRIFTTVSAEKMQIALECLESELKARPENRRAVFSHGFSQRLHLGSAVNNPHQEGSKEFVQWNSGFYKCHEILKEKTKGQ